MQGLGIGLPDILPDGCYRNSGTRHGFHPALRIRTVLQANVSHGPYRILLCFQVQPLGCFSAIGDIRVQTADDKRLRLIFQLQGISRFQIQFPGSEHRQGQFVFLLRQPAFVAGNRECFKVTGFHRKTERGSIGQSDGLTIGCEQGPFLHLLILFKTFCHEAGGLGGSQVQSQLCIADSHAGDKSRGGKRAGQKQRNQNEKGASGTDCHGHEPGSGSSGMFRTSQGIQRTLPVQRPQGKPDRDQDNQSRHTGCQQAGQGYGGAVRGCAVKLPQLFQQRPLENQGCKKSRQDPGNRQQGIVDQIYLTDRFPADAQCFHHSGLLPVLFQLQEQDIPDTQQGNGQNRKTDKKQQEDDSAIGQNVHHADQTPVNEGPRCRQPGVFIGPAELRGTGTVCQHEFNQCFLHSCILQPFQGLRMHQKPFGGTHHGIHLCIADKAGNDQRVAANGHDVTGFQIVQAAIGHRHIHFSGLDLRLAA